MKRQALTDKLLILGVDGMDPKMTRKFLAEGIMPNTARYLELGAAREDLRQLGALPTITPPCWTTLASGAYPGTHGITCYWRQSPDSLDAVVYNMDSRNCRAEQLWNVTAEAGRKTLVWHWPGSSWPPSSDSPNLHVVDGTQPGSVNMGVAQLDWEKIVLADSSIGELRYAPRVERPAGVGCIISDLNEITKAEADNDMLDLWYGDGARQGEEIRTYIMTPEDMEMVIESILSYDLINSPLEAARGWSSAPEGAKEFTVLTSGGVTKRPALILPNTQGIYDRVALYKSKKSAQPIVVLRVGEMVTGIVDDINQEGVAKPACRSMKVLELAADGSRVRLWLSNALDIDNDTLWQPKALLEKVRSAVGPVPPVSLIGGEDAELVAQIFEPSWALYDKWQADALRYLIDAEEYTVVFSHLHNVDCAGHQLWHLAKKQKRWENVDAQTNQDFIRTFYRQTDRYLGEFLPLLDEGWTIFILSDHGLLVGENFPPLIGEYGGLNPAIMAELGYTVLKKDENGQNIAEVDWSRTRAVQIRSNYIYLNLQGRDAYGIVTPEERYALEERIIDDLYNYRDKESGRRIIGIAMRNKDAILLGVNGPECGDIFFTVAEGFNRVHGDGLTTAEGAFDSSVAPIFIAAGRGIKVHYKTERVIRQVDIAPTAAMLLGVRFPAQCEGAPIYPIFSEEV